MKIEMNPVSQNFESAIPVYFYVKDRAGKLCRLKNSQKIKECNSYIIRNLTGSKKEINEPLIETVKMFDGDYLKSGLARSVYDKDNALVYLITGKRDTAMIDSMGAEIGKVKKYSKGRWGTTNSFEVFDTIKAFYQRAIAYAKRSDVANKDKRNSNRAFQAIFETLHKKDGSPKGFKFLDLIVTQEAQIVSK